MWEQFTQTQVSKHLHEVASGLASIPAKQTVLMKSHLLVMRMSIARGTTMFQDGNIFTFDTVLDVLFCSVLSSDTVLDVLFCSVTPLFPVLFFFLFLISSVLNSFLFSFFSLSFFFCESRLQTCIDSSELPYLFTSFFFLFFFQWLNSSVSPFPVQAVHESRGAQ